MILLNHGQPLLQQLFPAVFLIMFFIPFSYFTDSPYRVFQAPDARDSAKTRFLMCNRRADTLQTRRRISTFARGT